MINLERTPQAPPLIAPLQDDIERPLWSVMIPAYNCIHYLETTILSVLQQDRGIENMQIEVVDDCSTDGDVEELVMKIGKGRVGYYRQKKNIGSLRNFETCINRARGHYIHLFHGDDMVKAGFYEEIEKLFTEYPQIGAAFTNFEYVDDKGNKLRDSERLQDEPHGIVKDFLKKIGANQILQTCTVVVKRSTYESLGSFFGVHYGEDWEMWARIAANYPVAYCPKILARYRVHNKNISFNSISSGQNIKDIARVISTIEKYLPEKDAKKITRISRKNFSQYYAKLANDIYYETKNISHALTQTNGALKLSLNSFTLYEAIKLYIKVIIRYKI